MNPFSTNANPPRVFTRLRLASKRASAFGRGFGEKGATLVETGIVMPILLLMMFGAIEFGYLFMHSVAIANSIATGGRAGAATGSTVVADERIIKQVQSRKLALVGAKYLIVYKASGADGKAPSQCTSGGSVAGVCNVYTVNSDGSVAGSDAAWPASSRNAGSDYLGVAIVGKHQWLSGVFPDSVELRDSGAVLIEPQVAQVGPANNAVAFGEGPKWGTNTLGNPGNGGLPTGPAQYKTFWEGNLETQGTGGGDQGSGGTTQY